MVVIGPIKARYAGNLSERERGQMDMHEQIKHKLVNESGSQAIIVVLQSSVFVLYFLRYLHCNLHCNRGWSGLTIPFPRRTSRPPGGGVLGFFR